MLYHAQMSYYSIQYRAYCACVLYTLYMYVHVCVNNIIIIIIQEMESLPQMNDGQPLAWRAPRTGKVVRSIHTDPSVPYSQLQHCITPSPLPSPTHPRSSLSLKQLIAEALYIARPLVHCKICVFRARTHTHTHTHTHTLSLSLTCTHSHTHIHTHSGSHVWILSEVLEAVAPLSVHGLGQSTVTRRTAEVEIKGKVRDS